MFAHVLHKYCFKTERAAATRMRTRVRFNALMNGHVSTQVMNTFESLVAYGTHGILLATFAMKPFFMDLYI